VRQLRQLRQLRLLLLLRLRLRWLHAERRPALLGRVPALVHANDARG
tara:strand:- start:220 stop:360 length:141 start_codon:yes stop_codon:yes gene_type:complete